MGRLCTVDVVRTLSRPVSLVVYDTHAQIVMIEIPVEITPAVGALMPIGACEL